MIIIGVIIVGGFLFFLRAWFWQKEIKDILPHSPPAKFSELKNDFNQIWTETKNSLSEQFKENNNTKGNSLNQKEIEELKKKIEEKTK